MAEVPANSDSFKDHKLSEEDLKLIESEQRLLKARAPKGNPAVISVFGSGGMTGRSFVFVIDRSHSMGNQGLGVIAAARKELSAAINQLESNHLFQIVGYHESTHTMQSRRLLAANKENKLAVPHHIGNMSAFGATSHENGMIAALAFKPDVIMLMTDGGFPLLNETQLKTIHRLAPDGCEIHCVQFGIGPLQKSQNFMTRMAEQNEGTFRYIDVTKWKKQN
jgi:Ca-activated chloride channel family protein